MSLIRPKKGQQGRWPNALLLFFFPLILFFSFRWLVLETFVIPSESMVPNLLIHDHILVQKYVYGLKPMMGDGWLINWSEPKRGEVVVFRYPDNRDVFFIKRLVGLPGDKIEINGMNVKVNGELLDLKAVVQPEKEITFRVAFQPPAEYYSETLGDHTHFVRFEGEAASAVELQPKTFEVAKDSYFVMGDNRYNSQDSRFWGNLPKDLLVGRARYIWFSCEKMLEAAPYICDPLSLRLERLFKTIN